jgi:hypothetical protein
VMNLIVGFVTFTSYCALIVCRFVRLGPQAVIDATTSSISKIRTGASLLKLVMPRSCP